MSEHHHYHNSGGGFVHGLLLGALVGAGLVLLLGTKRGKEIADEIKEKGLSLADDFDELLSELSEDAGEQIPSQSATTITAQNTAAQQDPPTQPTETAQYSDVQSTNNYSTVKVEDTKGSNETPIPAHIETLQAHGRRFFTGIPKRR